MSTLWPCRLDYEPHLLLYQFQLLGFQQLLWDTLWACLCAKTEVPELLAKFRCILVKEAGELDLEDFDIGLCHLLAGGTQRRNRIVE